MSTVRSRWLDKLSTRRALLDKARRSVTYWARRAGSAHGKAMLREAKVRRALREQQVSEAERVLSRHPGAVTTMSDAGVALVAGFEGFVAKPYRDVVGVLTQGYGETQQPLGGVWTQAYAAARLRSRLNRDYLEPVLNLAHAVGLTLTQNEADALGSFVYNLGPGVLSATSSMGQAMRSKDRKRIADTFLLYDKAGGRRLLGLTSRRRAERALFLR